MTEISKQNFYKYWNSLINYAVTFKIRKEDAQDIATDTILKALEYFNKDRGNFETYCRFILKRKVLDFKRIYADTYLLMFIDDEGEIVDPEKNQYDEKETNELSDSFLKELKTELDEKELKLFGSLILYCQSSEKISVSAAAENIGLDKYKGWDLFRKIQRKAKQLNKNKIYESEKRNYMPEYSIIQKFSEDHYFHKLSVEKFSYNSNFIFFLNSLNFIQKRKLSKLFKN